ncbi:hypothetical protein [Dyella jiangningensis]|nr:hypothetical protein [Dyella jiangningensis]
MKAAAAVTIVAMCVAYQLAGGNDRKWAAIVAVSGGALVMLVIWEKRRRLLIAERIRKIGINA